MYSIRVTDYNGDLDTLREIYLIGPFETQSARDAELYRLGQLPVGEYDYDFEASGLDPNASGVDGRLDAASSVQVQERDDLASAFSY